MQPNGFVVTVFDVHRTSLPTTGILRDLFSDRDALDTQLWVELPTPADVRRYRQMLSGYAAEQQRLGRFSWKPRTDLRDMREWLALSPQSTTFRGELELAAWAALGFLLVCLVNAMALLLARFTRGNRELAVRRALGAPRNALLMQCLVETAVIGLLGGLLGLLLTLGGLQLERSSVPAEMAIAAHLDGTLVALTIGAALLATLCAGLYPAWRSSRLPSGWLLKAT
jgi:putative ABC transport system permease protein